MKITRRYMPFKLMTHYCAKCNKQVLHEMCIEADIETNGRDETIIKKWTLYICITCDGVSVRRET